MLVFYGVIESIVNPVIDILILNLEKYPGYAFPMRLFILLLFVFSKYLPISEYRVTFTCGVDSEGVVASILKCWIVEKFFIFDVIDLLSRWNFVIACIALLYYV